MIVLNSYWTLVIRLENLITSAVLCWCDKFNTQVEKVLECGAKKMFGSKRE